MLTQGAEKEADQRIVKFFGANTPTRGKAEFCYLDEDDVRKAAEKSGISGATPNGFVDYKHSPSPIVYINRYTKIEGTLEHETLHLYGLKLMGYYGVGSDHISHVFEGLTEYFTREIVSNPRISYQAELRAVQKLAGVLGEPNLRTMFFQWKPDSFINCLGQKRADEWKKLVNNQKWDEADSLLDGVKPCAGSKK